METFLSLLLILSALLAGAVSPGPCFVLIAKMSMGTSRNDGIAAAIGMGIGGVIFSAIALMGLHSVLTSIPILYFILKVFGGLYLIFIAARIWRGATQSLVITGNDHDAMSTVKKSFLIGLFTQLSNPKTALVYASIFAALLPANIPSIIFLILPPLVFLIETGWYLIVALMLSSAAPRGAYLKTKSLFDRIAGCVMAGLGFKLISSATIH